MSALQEMSETLIRENITRAIADVFKTMLGLNTDLCPASAQGPISWPPIPNPAGETISSPQVVGTVGFIGDVNGLIYLYLPASFAQSCTEFMLGMSAAEVTEGGDEVINDAIGELTNMSVGSFKNGLCDAGYPCKLTIPSILRGANFSIEPISSAERYIYRFKCGDATVVADILLKIGD
jgi:chemotaxis protein CheX